MPDLQYEDNIFQKFYQNIIAVDEAGRGAIAGPLVVAAIAVEKNNSLCNHNIDDSKKLTPKQRNIIYNHLIQNYCYCIEQEQTKTIEDINIHNATLKAMKNAILKLGKTICHKYNSQRKIFAIIDGKFVPDIDMPTQSIIKGDQKSVSIAAASVIAKVYRDEIMQQIHQKLPCYQFNKNKGYPTKFHLNAIQKFGISKYHRKTYEPVRKIILQNKQDKKN